MKISLSHSFFQFLAFIIGLSALSVSCQSEQSGTASYFSETERDTLLVNVITYMARTAPGADEKTRFKPQFRPFYAKQLPYYKFEEYTITPDSTHYYFVVRPVGEGKLFRRGVGGRFRLDKNLFPVDFEEIWCTPHFKDDSTIRERGSFLFSEMVKTGNVDKYLNMKHYVEWPDSTLRYDKQRHEWVTTGKTL